MEKQEKQNIKDSINEIMRTVGTVTERKNVYGHRFLDGDKVRVTGKSNIATGRYVSVALEMTGIGESQVYNVFEYIDIYDKLMNSHTGKVIAYLPIPSNDKENNAEILVLEIPEFDKYIVVDALSVELVDEGTLTEKETAPIEEVQEKKNYSVGDEVVIRKDLNTDIECDSGVIDDMLKYAGQKAKIVKVNIVSYTLDVDRGDYVWNNEMFEDVKEVIEPTKSEFDYTTPANERNLAYVCRSLKEGMEDYVTVFKSKPWGKWKVISVIDLDTNKYISIKKASKIPRSNETFVPLKDTSYSSICKTLKEGMYIQVKGETQGESFDGKYKISEIDAIDESDTQIVMIQYNEDDEWYIYNNTIIGYYK